MSKERRMSDESYDAVCRAQELLHALGSHVLSAREVVDQLDEVRRLLSARTDAVDDAMRVENELLREVFTQTQVIFEDARIDFVDVRVPRRIWLRLRSWRAADPAHGRAGSRWWRHDYLELRALETALLTWADEATDRERTSRMGELVATLLNELGRELAARVDEAVES